LTEPADPDLHQRAKALVLQLSQMLELEFDALRVQNLDEFERLQPVKNDLLAQLTEMAPSKDVLEEDPQWAGWLDSIAECRDMHRRNAVLMERKLESIRGALDSLRLPGTGSGVEVYDRLGHVSRFSRGRGYNEA
jgi:flagellar biosynthesis/type III secretory pathway chaperone